MGKKVKAMVSAGKDGIGNYARNNRRDAKRARTARMKKRTAGTVLGRQARDIVRESLGTC